MPHLAPQKGGGGRGLNLPCKSFPRTLLRTAGILCALLLSLSAAHAQTKRKVIIDQDCAGPGGTDMQAVLALINSPDTDVLGITVLTGDAWRDEEIAHTLRLLEIIGRTDIPVFPGAVFPLVNRKEYIAEWEKRYGKVVYQGAWNFARGHAVHGPDEIPPLPEGAPTIKASTEDAAHFLVRTVHRFPHEVTIYAAGPMTDLAMALALDSHFAELAKELIVMGGSINPQTDDPEFSRTPHREFNFWMDPEASHAVLHAHWPRIVLTTLDISLKTRMDQNQINEIAKSPTPAAQYVAKYAQPNYLWDELAAVAWLDPSIITKWQKLYIDVTIDHGPSYGNTVSRPATTSSASPGDANSRPAASGPSEVARAKSDSTSAGSAEADSFSAASSRSPRGKPSAATLGSAMPNAMPDGTMPIVDVQFDLDKQKFYRLYVDLLARPTPKLKAQQP